ncbi:BON domain-containing protein [Legionella londiniensis]|uniref:Putative periplasmic or secreted lipoprotein n=1 Tax=Legionella londiniensis TaxID=45068 RepID=A0A0W0VP13_9GAMM|nr:BON domain-containing protein [Legionella londiniensis]KTD21873.1 putative periplasmic or secreted lipoprotein [Legionella londiniensis]STX92644.1 putative periplasmic or secreted lipoprotein [Legionella londiniensis]
MIKIIKMLTMSLLALVIIACAATPTRESTGEYLDSSAVTAKVKAKLLNQLGARGFEIKVKTYKDEVQLSGFVDSASIKQRAGQIASSVANVKKVRNDLIIK